MCGIACMHMRLIVTVLNIQQKVATQRTLYFMTLTSIHHPLKDKNDVTVESRIISFTGILLENGS